MSTVPHDYVYSSTDGVGKCRNCQRELGTEHDCDAERLVLRGDYCNFNVVYTKAGVVKFYDADADPKKFTPLGQFVAEYYEATLMLTDGGLNLYGGVDAWSLSASDMENVTAWLEGTRQNVFVTHDTEPAWQTDEPLRLATSNDPDEDHGLFLQVYENRAVYVDVYDNTGRFRQMLYCLPMPAARALLGRLTEAIDYVDRRDLTR
jgi:hypothetical protein